MSLEITAGPDVGDAKSSKVARTVAAAESVLSKRFGATVRLADPEDLGGSDRSLVVRVWVSATPFALPRTLVIKHYGSAQPGGQADPFAHELASCQLFTAMAGEKFGPELVAHDSKRRLLVLEDLGRSPTLADRLLSDDARAAERALLCWARALGRLHANTAGREADFTALIRRIGAPSWEDPVVPKMKAALPELPDLLRDVLGVRTPSVVLEHERSAVRLLGGTRYRAFSTSDVCPDNNVGTSKGVRFVDFEWGCVRDVCLDAAALRVPFPSCWCAFALPRGMTEAMLAAWRAEVATIWSDLDDDDVLLPRLLDAQLLWVCLSTWYLLPRIGEADRPIATHRPSPTGASALAWRWQRLQSDAVAAGLDGLAAHAEAVVSALAARFGADVLNLPVYPAFR